MAHVRPEPFFFVKSPWAIHEAKDAKDPAEGIVRIKTQLSLALDASIAETFYQAAAQDREDLLEELQELGLSVDIDDAPSSRTALHLAVIDFSIGAVDVLLHFGANANFVDAEGNAPADLLALGTPSDAEATIILTMLARSSEHEIWRTCSSTSPPPSPTAFASVAGVSYGEVMEQLGLPLGSSAADTFAQAAFSDRADLINALNNLGYAISARDGSNNSTALHRAVWNLDRDAVTLLLAAHADPLATDRFGRTPLDYLVADEASRADPYFEEIREALLRASERSPLHGTAAPT